MQTLTERTISRQMMSAIDAAYSDVLTPVLHRHKATLDRLDKLMQEGKTDEASRLWRRSGLLDDMAKAIAGAGKVSADAIREGLKRTREAVHHAAE